MNPYETTLGSLAGFAPEILLITAALLIMGMEFLFKQQTERMPLFAIAALLVAVIPSIEYFCDAGREIPRYRAFAGAISHDAWTMLFRVIAMVAAAVALALGVPRGIFSRTEDDVPRVLRSTQGEFSVLILLSTAGVSILAAANDYLVLLIALEIMSLPLYPMITLAGGRRSYEAAVKYFLMGAAASAFMLFGLSLLMTATGTTRYTGVQLSHSYHALGFLLFASGLLFKAAVVPFHGWMPDAYQTTPSPLGAFMAAAVKAGAFAALGRLMAQAIPIPEPMLRTLMVLSALTMFMGNGSALAQKDLGRLLGFSSVAHTGFLLMGILSSLQSGKSDGMAAMAFYLLSYAPAVIAAYAVIGAVERSRNPLRSGPRSLSDLHGLFAERPLSAVALAIAMASLAGFPPTIGFWAKFDIIVSSYYAGHLGLVTIALVNSFMAAYYYVRVIRAAFADPDGLMREDYHPSRAFEIAAVIASLLLIVSGIMPNTMLKAAEIATGVLR